MSTDPLVMFQANAQHLVKIIRECPPDLTHLLEQAMQNTFGLLYKAGTERGYQLIDNHFVGEIPVFLLLKLLVMGSIIATVRAIDRFVPGSFEAAKKIWSLRRKVS
jgi:hypothetical protein